MTRRPPTGDPRRRPCGSPAASVPRLLEAGDAQLAVALRRGRRDALAEVYDRHRGAIFDVARALAGEGCGATVVQQAFLDLWHAPEDFDPTDTIRAHLVRRAHLAAASQTAHGSAPTALRAGRNGDPIGDDQYPRSTSASARGSVASGHSTTRRPAPILRADRAETPWVGRSRTSWAG